MKTAQHGEVEAGDLLTRRKYFEVNVGKRGWWWWWYRG
jgi:hypothetical protein